MRLDVYRWHGADLRITKHWVVDQLEPAEGMPLKDPGHMIAVFMLAE